MNPTTLLLRRTYPRHVSVASLTKLARAVAYGAGTDPFRRVAGMACLYICGKHVTEHVELWPESGAIVAQADASLRFLFDVDGGPTAIDDRLHMLALFYGVPGLDALGPRP